MIRRMAWAAGLLLGLGIFLVGQPVAALITADYPLKRAIKTMLPVMAKVEKLDVDKKNMVLVLGDSLKKDKPSFETMRVTFAQPSEDGQKDHVPEMLKRLANDLPVVVFIEKAGKNYNAMGYTNGTWFRMQCQDPATQPWRFLHCETYLRRTFKGTTEEMKQTILDDVAGKKESPPTNPKEEPGFGPIIEQKKSARPVTGGPIFGVIPMAVIGGPLAILSMLFPSLFGKPKEIMQRYLALMTTVTITGTVYLLQSYFENSIKQYWWGKPFTLWVFMAVVTLLGLVWARRRHRYQTGLSDAEALKGGEVAGFKILSLVALAIAPYMLGLGVLFKADGRPILMFCSVVWAGTLAMLYLQWRAGKKVATVPTESLSLSAAAPVNVPSYKPAFSLEGAMLAGLLICCVYVSWLLMPASAATTNNAGGQTAAVAATDQPTEAKAGNQPKLQGVSWTFEAPGEGTMDSTPLLTDKYIFAAVKIPGGFDNYGRLYCLDRATSKEVWKFDDEGEMKAVFSTPFLADGKLYIGEGYHQDKRCKLYCLDASNGKKLWEFKTKSHTESSPTVLGGKVFVGAGDDGLYCLDAKTGEKIWNYPNLHVDAAPAVVGNRVYCGSGVGDVYRDTAIFCVEADTGKELWRVPTELPVWGSPAVEGDRLYYGLGNGNFIENAQKPAGSLWCVDASNGHRIWTYEVANGVLNRPAVDLQNVYFTCRDGNCYAVERSAGRLKWKKPLGSSAVTSPALAVCPHCGGVGKSLYVVASGGQVYCLDTSSGAIAWSFDVAKHSGKKPQLFSSPKVVVTLDGNEERRRIYFGTGLDNVAEWKASLYCLEDRLALPTATAQAETKNVEAIAGR